MTVTVVVDASGQASGRAESADLVERYQEYVERKVASSRATRDGYSRLLDRVATGDVDPKTLERSLNWFWHAYGPDHAVAITELTMRFFTEVVQLAAEQSGSLIDDVAPDTAPRHRTEPPAVDPADWASWLARLIEYAEQERSAQRDALTAALEHAASTRDGTDESGGQEAPTSQHSSSTIVERLASLCFDVLAGLDGINADLGLRYLTAVVPDDGRDEVELDGEVGASVECRFVVSNDKPVPASVQCALTDMRREDGIGPAFAPSTTITPEDLRLPPDGSAQISCSIRLTEPFASGATYVGELRVVADDDAALHVPIRIRVSERERNT